MTPKSFLDLPLEVRQQVYRECLPRTSCGLRIILELPDTDGRLNNLREAIPQLSTEIWDEWRINCQVMNFLVTAEKWNSPPAMSLPNLDRLYIQYDQFPYPAPHYTRDDRYWKEKSLAIMHGNLCRFIAWLNQANNPPIDYLEVEFLGCEDQDIRWCTQQFNKAGEMIGYSLATRFASPGREVSAIESLLMPLKDFPVVRSACVCYFEGLEEWYKFKEFGIATLFDENYALGVCTAWDKWLEGKRDISWRRQLHYALRWRDSLVGYEEGFYY